MARRKPKEKDDAFILNPLWIKMGAGVLATGCIVSFLCYFEGVNRHVQADRRFSTDPVVASWYLDTKELVASQVAATVEGAAKSRPMALWYGKIRECRTSNPRSGNAPELLAVKLTDARLMAGAKGRYDIRKKEVIISTRNSSVAPRVGEAWLFSVWRDDQGYNHTKSARLYRSVGS
jgi:hypothetical protein